MQLRAQSGSAGCRQRRVTIVWLNEYHTTWCCFRCGAVTNPALLENGPSGRFVYDLVLLRALDSCTSIPELRSQQSAIWGFLGLLAPLILDRCPIHREEACLSAPGLDLHALTRRAE